MPGADVFSDFALCLGSFCYIKEKPGDKPGNQGKNRGIGV